MNLSEEIDRETKSIREAAEARIRNCGIPVGRVLDQLGHLLSELATRRVESEVSAQALSDLKAKVVESESAERLQRRRLPDDRTSRVFKFDIGGHEGYLIAGLYEDGTVGEIFIRMAKEGSTVAGTMDSFAIAISTALQYGVPLTKFIEKFKDTRFEPAGTVTCVAGIERATSVFDLIFRILEARYYCKEPNQDGDVE